MLRLLARLDSLDPRWLYLALAAVVVLPLVPAVRDLKLPMSMGHEAMGFYDAIQRVPAGGVVLVHSDWDAGTLGELRGQFAAVVDHLFRRNIKFAVVSAIPQGASFSDRVINQLAGKYGKRYGEDWVQFGYRIPNANIPQGIQALSKDFPKEAREDLYEHKKSGQFPWLKPVSNFGDFDLVISVAYVSFMEYIQFGYEVYGTPYVCGVCSISSSDLYPKMDAGQIKGMLVGARGGAEYEEKMELPAYMRTHQRTGPPDSWTDLAYATKVIKSQSWAHLLLIFGAVLGNVGFYARRKLQAREGQ